MGPAMIPGLNVWRPADGIETAMAWSYAVGEGDPAPHALVFTRQGVGDVNRPKGFDQKQVWKGGYVLRETPKPDATLVATGSELATALEAADALKQEGFSIRIVSMPCLERFLAQPESYQKLVLPRGVRVASIEAGRAFPWKAITGLQGLNLGVDTSEESAPAKDVYRHFGLDTESVTERVAAWIRGEVTE